jgi:hypothetical protein
MSFCALIQQAKRQLLLGMAMNTCFYMVLKAGGHSGVKNHPVMERLLQFQQLTQQLQPVDAELVRTDIYSVSIQGLLHFSVSSVCVTVPVCAVQS